MPPELSQLLTVKGAAHYLGVSPSTVRKLISDRQLPTIRIGRALRVSRHALEIWISEHEGVANAA